jgi:hypothetical protein
VQQLLVQFLERRRQDERADDLAAGELEQLLRALPVSAASLCSHNLQSRSDPLQCRISFAEVEALPFRGRSLTMSDRPERKARRGPAFVNSRKAHSPPEHAR